MFRQSHRTVIPKNLLSVAIDSALAKNGKAVNQANIDAVRQAIGTDEDEWTQENLTDIIQKLRLELPRIERRPFDRDITAEEALALLEQVLKANPWVDINEVQNGELIMAAFYSNQTSPRKDLNDMVEALRIVAPRMKRTPPPAPPKFQDEDLTVKLPDGSSKLPLHVNAMHQSKTHLQRLNLIERLRRQEAWDREHK